MQPVQQQIKSYLEKVYLVICNPCKKDVGYAQGELATRQQGMAASAATVLLPALNGGVPERKGT